MTALYFPPDFPKRIIDFLADKSRWVKSLCLKWKNRMASVSAATSPIWQSSAPYRKSILFGLAFLISFHTLVPLRHHLFPGSVAWTEEGHRYSWRMMLRSKQGKGNFRLADQNRAVEIIDPGDYLTGRQERKMYTHPDMILQFAHHLRDVYAAKGKTVSIYADIEARLNDHPYQTYINPEVDLAKEEWPYFRHAKWILPLLTK